MKVDRIICIGRQLGSGGRTVAKQLAEHFGYAFYDKELLNLAARESGFSEKVFEQNDERKGFFRTLFRASAAHHVTTDPYVFGNQFSEESLFQFQSDAIRKAADEGPCVFVGRCADYILRDNPALVSIFITANLDDRLRAVAKRHECDEAEAAKILQNKESQRANYYNYYTGWQWGQAANYDLCVNTSVLGIEKTTLLIQQFIELIIDNG